MKLGLIGWIAVALLGLGAAVRALRFWGRFRYLYSWDETSIAIPALRILDGQWPVHFLGMEYAAFACSARASVASARGRLLYCALCARW